MLAERSKNHLRLVIALLVLILVTACSGDDGEFNGKRLENPYTAPGEELTATDGSTYSLKDDTDKPLTMVFFGYTNCPDICPIVMQNLAAAMNNLDAADRKKVDVVFVTTDPERDTAQALRQYLDGIDTSFEGLTGSLDDIIAAGKALAVYVSDGKKLPSGGYDLGGHTTSVIAIDADDHTPAYWSQDTSPRQYAEDIHTLLKD